MSAPQVRDAYAVLAHALTLSYVDGQRVRLMGGSHGGSATLAASTSIECFGVAASRHPFLTIPSSALYQG